jgi:hypothetical protein
MQIILVNVKALLKMLVLIISILVKINLKMIIVKGIIAVQKIFPFFQNNKLYKNKRNNRLIKLKI